MLPKHPNLAFLEVVELAATSPSLSLPTPFLCLSIALGRRMYDVEASYRHPVLTAIYASHSALALHGGTDYIAPAQQPICSRVPFIVATADCIPRPSSVYGVDFVSKL